MRSRSRPSGPVEAARGTDGAVVADLAGEPGGLPLLSITMRQLWEQSTIGALTIDAYVASGGVHDAVGRLAEESASRDSDPARATASATCCCAWRPPARTGVVRSFVPLESIDAREPDAWRPGQADRRPPGHGGRRPGDSRTRGAVHAVAAACRLARGGGRGRRGSGPAGDGDSHLGRLRPHGGRPCTRTAPGRRQRAPGRAPGAADGGRAGLRRGEHGSRRRSRGGATARGSGASSLEHPAARRCWPRPLPPCCSSASLQGSRCTCEERPRTRAESRQRVGWVAEALTTGRLDVSLLLAAQAASMDPGPQTRSDLIASLARATAGEARPGRDGTAPAGCRDRGPGPSRGHP